MRAHRLGGKSLGATFLSVVPWRLVSSEVFLTGETPMQWEGGGKEKLFDSSSSGDMRLWVHCLGQRPPVHPDLQYHLLPFWSHLGLPVMEWPNSLQSFLFCFKYVEGFRFFWPNPWLIPPFKALLASSVGWQVSYQSQKASTNFLKTKMGRCKEKILTTLTFPVSGGAAGTRKMSWTCSKEPGSHKCTN